MPHVAGVADSFGSVQPRDRTMWERAFPFLMAPGPPLSLMAVLFVCVMTALTPLAHASPSDPSWIAGFWDDGDYEDRKSTRLNSSHRTISYAVFCLNKKKLH